MKTKLLTALLTAALCLGMLTGCGGNGGNADQPQKEQSTPSGSVDTNDTSENNGNADTVVDPNTDSTDDDESDTSVIRTEQVDSGESPGAYKIIEYYEDGTRKERFYTMDGSIVYHIAVFDADGKLIATESDVLPNGEIRSKTTFKYDERDNLIEKSKLWLTNNSTEVNLYEYDAENRVISEKYLENDVLLENATYEYDVAGNIIQAKRKDQYSFYWDVYEYDSNNNMTKDTRLNEDGSIDEYWVYEYNADGKETLMTEYDAEGNITETIVYEYANEELVKMTESRADGLIRTVTEYKDGSVVKETEYYGDMITKVTEY